MPRTVLHLLQDTGSVQQLDDAAHRHRKRLFLDILRHHSVDGLIMHFARSWRGVLPVWQARGRIVLHEEAYAVLTHAALAFAGISVTEAEAGLRRREFRGMIEHSGGFGVTNLYAQLLRRRCERWSERLIRDARRAEPSQTPLGQIARHRDADGRRLDARTAAVKLINLLRPIAAVAVHLLLRSRAGPSPVLA